MNWRITYLATIACLFNGLLCWGQAEPSEDVSLISLPNAYGQIIDPGANAEQGLVLVFTNHNCLYSQLYLERLNALYEEFSSFGIPLIAIETKIDSFESSIVSLANYLAKVRLSFPYLIDLDNELAKALGAESSPHAFLLKKSNEGFQLVYEGSIDNNSRNPIRATRNYLKDAVNQLVTGEEIAYPTSKSIGCDISRN